MGEPPLISWMMLQQAIQNTMVVATLVLLYHFIPDSVRSRSRLAFPVCVGAIFGIAAAISAPLFWEPAGAQILGFNVILIPLAAYVAGPIASAIVAIVLLAESLLGIGSFESVDLLTIMNSLLLGSFVYWGKSRNWFPKSPWIRLCIIGAGIVLIEILSSALSSPVRGPGGPGGPPMFMHEPPQAILLSNPSLLVITFAGTLLVGAIITFIDRKKEVEAEVARNRDHLEELVKERTLQLKRANSLQRATLEATADGIIVTDLGHVIRAYNRKAAQILNIPQLPPSDLEENLLYFDHILASLSDPDVVVRRMESLNKTDEQVVMKDVRFTTGRIFELSIQPQRIGDQIIGRVWSLHDVTEQRIAEGALTAANTKLNLLSTLTRHDIFNQLTALSGHLELAQMKNHDPALEDNIGSMKKSLDVIRLQLEFTRDYQDLGLAKPAWHAVEPEFYHAAEAFTGKNITFRCGTGTLEVFADPMIGRVFYNLIDNSIRHGGQVSAITLSTSEDSGDVLLIYEDNGSGIAENEKERIFVKGFGKHTGLGMFLIREILSITGIAIRENGMPGTGVRFEIRVPAGRFRYP